MDTDDSNIIDAEIVEASNRPAAVDPGDASNSGSIHLPNRQDAILAGNPDRRCVATNSRGERCRKFAIYGATVCRTHGGATKRVKQAARIRVENAQNKLVGKLIEFAFDDNKPPDVQLRAIRDALDRGGLKPPAEVVLSQAEARPAYETVFESIGGDPASSGFDSPLGVAGCLTADALAQRDMTLPNKPPPHHNQPTGQGDTASAREKTVSTGAERSRHLGLSDDDESARGPDGVESSRSGPPRQPRPRERDRDRQPQPPSRHITGEAAIQVANWANRAMAESHGLPWGQSDRRRR